MTAPSRSRSLLTHGLVACLGLGAGYVVSQDGRGMPTDRSAPVALAARPQPGLRSFRDAQVEARARRVPVLLLVSPPCERCPPGLRLRTLLSEGPGAAELAACCVPALLEVDPGARSPETVNLAARVGEAVLPYLLVLAPTGQILQRQFGRLYPVYDVRGRPVRRTPPEDLHDAASLVRLVDGAVGRGLRETRRIVELRAGRSAAGWAEAAELLEGQGAIDEALAEARRALPQELGAGVTLRLARLLERRGREAEAIAALVGALDRSPPPAERDRLALLLDRVQGLPGRAGGGGPLPTLAEVLADGEARKDGSVVLEARARQALALASQASSDREALRAHLVWCRQHLGDLPPDAREGMPVLKDLLRASQGVEDPALRAAFMRAQLDRYPEHPASQEARHGFLISAEEAAAGR
jgi:hypothetical protein